MPVTLLVPGLLDVDAAALAACPLLSRIAARATAEAVDDAEQEILRSLGGDAFPAPIAALGAGCDVNGAWIARADPVATFVSHEDVRIVGRVDDLDDAEAASLLDLMNAHFAADGLVFIAPRRDAWFVRSAQPQAFVCVPLSAAIGRPLRARLPTGGDGGRWRRWWTEVQMLLHEHPLAQRERHPVTALWFSGGGVLPSRRGAVEVLATSSREGDLLRGLARLAGTTASSFAHLQDILQRAKHGVPLAITVDPVRDGAGLDVLARQALGPLLDTLDRGGLDEITVFATGCDSAARWRVKRAGLLDRLVRRRAPFVPPRLARDP